VLLAEKLKKCHILKKKSPRSLQIMPQYQELAMESSQNRSKAVPELRNDSKVFAILKKCAIFQKLVSRPPNQIKSTNVAQLECCLIEIKKGHILDLKKRKEPNLRKLCHHRRVGFRTVFEVVLETFLQSHYGIYDVSKINVPSSQNSINVTH
jgi:hypothetical protein